MQLFRFIKREIEESLLPIGMMIMLCGTTNVLLIETISSAAEKVVNNENGQKLFLLFILLLGICLLSRKYVLEKSSLFVEEAVAKARLRLGNKIRQTELSTLEEVGVPPLQTCVTQDIWMITNKSAGMTAIAEAFTIVVFMLFYISWLSIPSFLLVILGLILVAITYSDSEQYTKNWKELSDKETAFFEKFGHILSGFKEIRINNKKNDSVFNAYVEVNNNKKEQRIQTDRYYNKRSTISQACFYGVVLFIVFVLPYYYEQHADTLIKVVAAILFIIGPSERILNYIPTFALVENAANNVLSMEKYLDETLMKVQGRTSTTQIAPSETALSFQSNIQLNAITYYYGSDINRSTFGIGPINLTFKKGELIFIIGGNGSGKSTFLKTLIGLYMPQSGTIHIDEDFGKVKKGTLVTATNHKQYRSLFTTIFTDYHLFDKLYGLRDIDENRVTELIEQMDLPKDKVSYQKGAFSNIRLSSGQKKKLALIVSILEDKDIYIYDEVAADLDPWFREVYYHKILSELKARKKTVFVVSHDKEYWHIADRILYMDNGNIKELTEGEIKAYHQKAAAQAREVMSV